MNMFWGGKSPSLRAVLSFGRALMAESGVGDQGDKSMFGQIAGVASGKGLGFHM